MPHLRSATFALLLVTTLACMAPGPSTSPTTRPTLVDTFAFIDEFRSSTYLRSAVQLQVLPPDRRAAKLREMAGDPQHASEVYPLCRMLFDTNDDPMVHRPWIGGASFVGGGTYTDWPLEPVTLRDDVPILMVRGYMLAGKPEPPLSYVDRMIKECRWRDTKFAEADTAKIKKAIEGLIVATPNLSDDDKARLRRQAE